ncbi:glycyl-radical enzyme activating protein [Desulforhopalus sp. IMCC35007]|uniref:glycyl-radical enzyme activating protein n=1 Tax=Desulforhopalus sp. IMCC35007 TaxID=2569543 RepID=UPI0010AE12C4|nr:glycyl-radical enzyme activating protein [Desulforhopalus sp. IMCC35007]TKB06159.1 glycyl-radical enzyme activating protein [Desulforhopalus sp. IMCC35007]
MTTAIIGSIGRYSIHDGPGIRTTLFFKGCPLSCLWCHNPEFQEHYPEISFNKKSCIGCGDCAAACPVDAITVESIARIDLSLCTYCMACIEVCPSKALQKVGVEYHLDELMEILLRDQNYYLTSGGGVTLSGGEPTSQMDFSLELTLSLHKKKIHTAIETCGFFNWNDKARQLFETLDLIYFDVKRVDSKEHIRCTGQDNSLIIENLQRLTGLYKEKLIVSIPIIPTYTATTTNLRQIAELLEETGVTRARLLPYHPFGLHSQMITRKPASQPQLPDKPMNHKELRQWQNLLEGYSFEVIN